MLHVKEFFYDRFVLFLLSLNAFLAVITVLSILFRLGNSEGIYVFSYRSNLGLGGIETSGLVEILSFMIFAIMVFVFQLFMAIKFYNIRRPASWAIMILTCLLLTLNLIVANSLLDIS